MWEFHRQILRIEADLSIRSWNMENELFRKKKWAWVIFWNLKSKTIDERDAQEKVVFYSIKRTFTHSNAPGKWVECLCDPPDGNNSIAEHLPKCANHNRLATLHLEYIECRIYLITYMQRISCYSENVQKIN